MSNEFICVACGAPNQPKMILFDIGVALEKAGYVHMANEAGINAILQEVDTLRSYLRKCHTAMVGLIGVETSAELLSMKTIMKGIAALTEDPKDAEASIALIDALIDTGYRNDGTCAGDAAKCCGNCGDEGVKGGPSEPPAEEVSTCTCGDGPTCLHCKSKGAEA